MLSSTSTTKCYGLSTLVVGFLVLGAIGVGVAGATTASLTAQAIDEGGHPAEGGTIVLYTAEWEVIEETQVNSNGEHQFDDIDPGTYNLELYGPDGAFWASAQVTITEAERTEVTLRRSEPYVTDIKFVEGEQDDTYHVDETITISPKVLNGRSFSRQARVKIAVDTNGDATADTEVIRGPLDFAEGESNWYGYDFKPAQDGTVAVRITVESRIADKWVTTANTGWTESITVQSRAKTEQTDTTVEQPESPEQQANAITATAERTRPRSSWLPIGIIIVALLTALYVGSLIISR